MDYSTMAQTYGAILVGGFAAAFLSGALALQCLLYLKLFPRDLSRVKAIVGVVWLLDQSHSIMVYATIWNYMIKGFGNYDIMETIPVPLAISVQLTGVVTSIVHSFFTYRIHRLSGRDWRLTSIIATLAFCRLCAATVTTVEMIRLPTLEVFKTSLRWLFTVGLALSCTEDVLVASFLIYSIQVLQDSGCWQTSSGLNRVVGSVILYTLETNSLTAIWTVVCMVCWQTMPDNFVFLGVHFLLCKLYANSLLATLNARKQFQSQQQYGLSMDISLSLPRFSTNHRPRVEPPSTTKIFVKRTVEYSTTSNEDQVPPPSSPPPPKLTPMDRPSTERAALTA